MATTAKAIELLKGIEEELTVRLGLAHVFSFEVLSSEVSDGATAHPQLLVGSGTATQATCRIVVKPIEWSLARDCLGLASPVYTPHEILLGIEAVSGAGAEPLSLEQKATIISVLAARGCRLVVFESASGDSFDVADFLTANKKAVIEPNVKYAMVQSQ